MNSLGYEDFVGIFGGSSQNWAIFRGHFYIVSEYDQEIPQSQTADNPVAPRGKAAQPSRDTMKTN